MNESTSPAAVPDYTGIGFLVVKISTAKGAIPISGALVTIHDAGREDNGVYAVMLTDADGIARKIPLPAPPKSRSESSGQASPFAVYNIEVVKEGYYNEEFAAVPIFDTITSIQTVYLVPLTRDGFSELNTYQNTRFYENQNPDL